MPEVAKVLIVDDDREWLDIYSVQLRDDSYELSFARSLKQTQKLISDIDFDVVATDLRLLGTQDSGGMDVLHVVKKHNPTTQVIIFTAYGGTEDAIFALKQGAFDYLVKPLNYSLAKQAIRAAIGQRQALLEGQLKLQEEREKELPRFPEKFVADSEVMREVLNEVTRQGKVKTHLLIIGPRGAGKGLIAEGVHLASQRKRLGLVNCTSVSEITLEHILFGSNDSSRLLGDQDGLIDTLENGTLILDRISGMSKRLQAMLLSRLQERALSSENNLPITNLPIRIIGIDDTDLEAKVTREVFMPELYNLLASTIIRVPPLRDRRDQDPNGYDDIRLLAEYFIKKYNESGKRYILTSDAEKMLSAYNFPDNVWELQEAIRFALVTSTDGFIDEKNLPDKIVSYQTIRGLGAFEETESPLCPHGNFRCKQAKLIATNYFQGKSVYIRISSNSGEEISKQVTLATIASGFMVSLPNEQENLQHVQCRTCIPIQSCQYAIIDLTDASPQVWYEVGVLYSLGIKTLLISNSNKLTDHILSQVVIYKDAHQARAIAKTWLESQSKIG